MAIIDIGTCDSAFNTFVRSRNSCIVNIADTFHSGSGHENFIRIGVDLWEWSQDLRTNPKNLIWLVPAKGKDQPKPPAPRWGLSLFVLISSLLQLGERQLRGVIVSSTLP